jgi:hypothetical protein
MLQLDGKWASLSVDIAKGVTHLIHPAWAGTKEEDVLAIHGNLCKQLTHAALGHMMPFLEPKPIPTTEWVYKVPLERQPCMHE